jgi:hypothetical protein
LAVGVLCAQQLGRPENITTKERCKMDDNMREFYKAEIDKLIDQATDVGVLDLVYKILLLEV